MNFYFFSPDRIRPTENTDFSRVQSLIQKITRQNIWTQPLWVEKNSLAVMDGNHRLQAALQMKLIRVPCFSLEYHQVDVKSTCKNHKVTGARIIEKARSGKLYPYKATKHTPFFPLPYYIISLNLLKTGTLPSTNTYGATQ